MRLLGKDFSPRNLAQVVEDRLRLRGLVIQEERPIQIDGPEPRVDPLSFNLAAIEEHADCTRPLPTETHRGGLSGSAVVLAKRLFRTGFQVFINEALARQRLFNGHVRDSYAQLAATVLELEKQVEALSAAEPTRKKKRSPPARS